MSTKLIKLLSDFGCRDIETTMMRFLDDEKFYHSILLQLLNDYSFDLLGLQLSDNDVKSAFETAHTLKGVIANCGITPMLELINSIVEPLREGKSENLIPIYNELMFKKDDLCDLIKKYEASQLNQD